MWLACGGSSFDEVFEDPTPFVEEFNTFLKPKHLSSQYVGPSKLVIVFHHVTRFSQGVVGSPHTDQSLARVQLDGSGISGRTQSPTSDGMTTLAFLHLLKITLFRAKHCSLIIFGVQTVVSHCIIFFFSMPEMSLVRPVDVVDVLQGERIQTVGSSPGCGGCTMHVVGTGSWFLRLAT